MIYGYVSVDEPGNYIYFISDSRDAVKIGITKDRKKRLAALQTANASKLFYLAILKVNKWEHAQKIEQELHNIFADAHLEGEWYKGEKVIPWLLQDEICVGGYKFEGFSDVSLHEK